MNKIIIFLIILLFLVSITYYFYKNTKINKLKSTIQFQITIKSEPYSQITYWPNTPKNNKIITTMPWKNAKTLLEDSKKIQCDDRGNCIIHISNKFKNTDINYRYESPNSGIIGPIVKL